MNTMKNETAAKIHLDLDAGIYASSVYLANGRSVLRAIRVRTNVALENASLHISYTPDYIETQRIWTARLAPGEEYVIKPERTDYRESALRTLDSREEGAVRVELRSEDGSLLAASEEKFTWLAHDIWPRDCEAPELLAAHVLPADPAVGEILSRMPGQPKEPDAWPGYQEEPRAVRDRIAALWNTLQSYVRDHKLPCDEKLHDLHEDQRVRTPSLIREKGYATCLDSTLLMAACLTRLKINPIIILARGHAYLCAALQKTPLPTPCGTPLAAVRNHIAHGEIIAIETTFLCSKNSFEEAVNYGLSEIHALSTEETFDALDIEQIWHELGIPPIIGGLPPVNHTGDSCADADESLISATPCTRMESWQRKLLDLSLRNNLLNTKTQAKYQLPLAVPSAAELEDKLANGATFRIKTLPEHLWADIAKTPTGNSDTPQCVSESASSMFHKNELLALTGPATLQKALHGIYTASRRELEESGSNTLFIACGFLRWTPKGHSEENALSAPLLLLPVRLNRTSVRDGFTLKGIDEEANINHTLLELLKVEYTIRIPELEGELPKDDSGIDVSRIFDIMRAAISGVSGWEVTENCLLGMFSFAKFLMWRDLAEQRDKLILNPVVKQLAAEGRAQFPEQVGFPNLDTLDHEVDAHKVYTPLPADSSQLAAILAAARGKSFVLEGPPGTGKSQTIANMIAHCLGHGKTVLFVAEKAVALEVVHKRLERIGLGNFCMELHSNKTLSSLVMAQFRKAVEGVSAKPGKDDWDENVQTMTELRYHLNRLPREMHREYPDGSTLYGDLCRLTDSLELPELPLNHIDPLTCTRSEKKDLLACAHELAAHFKLLEGDSKQAAQHIHAATYTQTWADKVTAALQSVSETSDRIGQLSSEIAERLELTTETDPKKNRKLTTLLSIAATRGDYTRLLPLSADTTLQTLDTALKHATEYRRLKATLSLPYPDSMPDAPELDTLLMTCKQASAQIWPLRWWNMRKVNKALQQHALSAKTPDSAHDLQTLIDMRAKKQALEAAETIPDFLNKGTALTEAHLCEAYTIAAALSDTCDGDENFAEDVLLRYREADNDTRIQRLTAACRTHAAKLDELRAALAELQTAPTASTGKSAPMLNREWADSLLACKDLWRDITLWNKKADEARKADNGSLVTALLSESVPPQKLEQAVVATLSRRRLQAAAEQIEALRDFSPTLHEERIRDFCLEDKDLRSRTSEHIRNILTTRAAGISQYGSEVAVLQRELSKKRMYMPLRRLLASTPNITPLLKPCFLMSPLSVAQYLTAETKAFDVVIFDEASQIPVWDAIGAIGRGKSVIITGDSRQMPPTSFFARNRADEDEDSESEPNLESILDECLACGIPKMNLTWHYRSKSEALIAFSNANYYEGKMTTFPAPTLRDTALCLHYVGGLYEPGASKRINMTEAQAVVQHILATLRSPGFRYTEATSIGIVTFNAQQQKLITDMLEDERAKDPALEPFFAEENPEAVFIKNLENVQGDERGVIYFSTTYGKDAEGRMSMNFGPLNLTGGERRLNVAVTRARYGMHVFTSMRTDDIDLNRTRARGVADLRSFLEFADHGAQLSASGISAKERDKLAQHIAAELGKHGHKCRTGIGASDYQVDIVVEHPDIENAVLAGITLDGRSYHAAHTARDRDIVRPDTMHTLGWRMLNLWAIDWWHTPTKCLNTLRDKLNHIRTLPPEPTIELPDLTPHAEESSPRPAQEAPKPAPADKVNICAGEAFEPYITPKPLSPLTKQSDSSLQKLILAIAAAEAPLSRTQLQERMLELAPVPGARNTRAYKEQLAESTHRIDSITESLHAAAKLHLHTERADDSELHIITLPGKPAIRPRTCGSRTLTEIPYSELAEIADYVQAGLKCLPGSDEQLRGMNDYLALGRLTKKTKDHLLLSLRYKK